jgi:three-Cys-motif partner protein
MPNSFFQIQHEQSQIKSRIVSRYFDAWSNIILNNQYKNAQFDKKMAYIDLFAGPGMYEDQNKSTPLLIMEKTLNNNALSDRMVFIFNDINKTNIDKLQNIINQLSNINKLKVKPKFFQDEINDAIADNLNITKLVPSLFFIDPWGYKGLSLKLFSSLIKDKGSDGIIFLTLIELKWV